MELTSLSPNTFAAALPSESSIGSSATTGGKPARTPIFPEYEPPESFAAIRQNPPARISAQAAETPLNAPPLLSRRQPRGAMLGACAKSEFRECRGGDALNHGASSHINFDQFDRKQTRGTTGRGTCDGITREMIRRIDRSYGDAGAKGDLLSAVNAMTIEMSGGRTDETNVFHRIAAFQDNPATLGLAHYQEAATVHLNPHGTASRTQRIDDLIENMSELPEGALASVYVGIGRPDEWGIEASGHVLLVQRLQPDSPDSGNAGTRASRDGYAIFDPNNGAFTYESQTRMQTALRDYMDSAYAEDAEIATPNRIVFFTPPSDRDSHPPASPVPLSAPLTVPLEPPELAQHTQSRASPSGPAWRHTDF